MTDWNDLFVRTDVSETSPTGRVGGLSSPDIIPAGTVPVDPSQYTAADSYAGFVSNTPFQQDQANYIYVRAKNSAQPGTPANGQAFLVLTNPAVVIWPGGDGWTRIKTQQGNYFSPLQPSPTDGQQVAVTTDPFVYVPPDSGHRCLVTWLSTTAHPVLQPPPRITTGAELAAFLQAHPNYAHHNIDIAPNTTGAHTSQKPFSTGDSRSRWSVGLQVTNCKGFTVSFSSGTPLPDGSYMQLEPTVVQQDTTVALMIGPFEFDQEWQTMINYTYQTNNLQPAGFSVEFVAYMDVERDHPLWEAARPYEELNVPRHMAPANRRGIVLGSIGLMNNGAVKK